MVTTAGSLYRGSVTMYGLYHALAS
eukprot:COSAG01_NODE_75421_length_196_cov_40.742268_2_plen_24_part_01